MTNSDSTEVFDVCVCGGGLAGLCAAVAAARHGANTVLIHDRPVLGGNSSSEIRVTPHGAAQFHAYARETGIISELLIEERAQNHEPIVENGWTNSVWDMVLYDLVQRTPRVKLMLNTSLLGVRMGDGSLITESRPPNFSFGYAHRPACPISREVSAVIVRTANAEIQTEITAQIFIDCTGDAILSHLAGCEWRMGTESLDEFNEPHAPNKSSTDIMGSTLMFKARDMGRPVPFQLPDWATYYDSADFFYKQGRVPADIRAGYWWIEIGVPWDTIRNNEDIRHELTRHVLGVWNWIKNLDPQLKAKAANFGLDWIGQVPGKRESRRVMGRYLITEHDIQNKTVFPDEIAYGGWFIDLHTPGGLLASTSEPLSAEEQPEISDYARKSYAGPYGIPLRSLIAKDVDNLLLAGRNISVTHAALGSVRVMATTALLGQAAGTAAATALSSNLLLAELPAAGIREIHQKLVRDDCFLPSVSTPDAFNLARTATVTASSEMFVSGAEPMANPDASEVAFLEWERGRRLTHRTGQLIAGAINHLDQIAICLSNHSPESQTVCAELHAVEHIWDYRVSPGKPRAITCFEVPSGEFQWVNWRVDQEMPVDRWWRLDLSPNPNVTWEPTSAVLPGYVASFDMGGGKMRRFSQGRTLCFRTVPAQPSFAAVNVITQHSRPYEFTNLWLSDPTQSLPQSLTLEWADAIPLQTVELVFPGNLRREYHHTPPLYRDPLCPRDYRLEITPTSDEDWHPLTEVVGNYQRFRRHTFPSAIPTRRLRLVVSATNGDSRAGVFAIRCYA